MIDRHHILHERSTWSSSAPAKTLRTTRSLIPRIDREWHEAIHHDLPAVPMLGSYALRRTLTGFDPTGDTIRDIEGLARSMDRATKGSHRLERELAGLAIENITAQRPYIIDGMIGTPRLVVVNNFEGLNK